MISVIVPVYNSSKYLEKCIESILGQKNVSLELILFDDASIDDSFQICKRYEQIDNRVKAYRNDVNSGQAVTYCKGISKTSGDYIAFVDSDDWIDSDMLTSLYNAAVIYHADLVACGCKHIYETKTMVEPENIEKIGVNIFTHEQIVKASENLHYRQNIICDILKLYRWNKLFARTLLIQNLRFIDPSIRVFEDNNLSIPCILDANKVVYVNKPFYNYRRRSQSTMTLFGDHVILSNKMFLQDQFAIFEKKKIHHNMESDAFIVASYSISKILLAHASFEKKLSWLRAVRQDMNNYGVKLNTCYKCGATAKFTLIFNMVRLGWYFPVLLIGKLYGRSKTRCEQEIP